MNVQINWTCPHCDIKQVCRMEVESPYSTTRKIVFCDVDEGGCDEPVALFVNVITELKVHKLVEVNP